MSFSQHTERSVMPMLALRGLVIFPGMLLHFDVGRKKSILALNQAMAGDQLIFLVSQRDLRDDDPELAELYEVGCVAKIRQILKLPGDTIRVLVEGEYRAVAAAVLEEEPCFVVETDPCAEIKPRNKSTFQTALVRHVRALFEEYASLTTRLAPDVGMTVMSSEDPGYLSDYIASNIPLPLDDRQYVLETLNPVKRLELIAQILSRECEILGLDAEISEKVKNRMDENQREYYLREQLKIIHQELYEDSPQDEADRYREKIEALKAPDEVREKLFKEVDRLFKMPSGSHEATVVRNYLDTCLELPWGKFTKDRIDIGKAEKILNKEHYGMEKVKQRILELLSVHSLAPDIPGQIICLVGPPGVGKTSIARSVAKCMGRKFARVSLGGVHDEAEIRGHRKTYIGAMPGRIISAVRQAGSSNPLILLDEVDKLGGDFRGDPASALLETLDAEQNSTFRDHYIDLPFDLSRTLFLTTANSLDTIPGPLLDRMEVIPLSSYTREDKFHIAKNHLLKKQLKRHGLTLSSCKIADDAIYGLIDGYTREAGVRKLEREIASLCRKAAKEIVSSGAKKVTVTAADLARLLGPAKYKPEQILPRDEVGVVNGLAWTSVGGEIMQLEVAALDGSGKVVLTGSLGDVMKESAQTAVSYVRGRAGDLGIDSEFYKNKDIHIHATEAAVPKDGPSAGVAITTALVSALTGNPIRRDVAMTGEVTLLGRVLPIGGLKEKTMAAYRAGVQTVFVPQDNQPDLSEVDPVVKEHITFLPVHDVWQILQKALVKPVTAAPVPTAPEYLPAPFETVKKDVPTLSQ